MAGSIFASENPDVATVTISNPGKLNALDLSMWQSLASTFRTLRERDTVRCIIIEGEGDTAFSAGADIAEFEATRSTPEQVAHFHENIVGACLTAIADCAIPVVAKIRGACIGGGLEIASVCDIRLADTTSRFGAPVGRLGFPLAFAETQALFNLVGPTVAAELLLEGRILKASEARDRRLVTRLSPPERLDADVRACVAAICESGRVAMRSHKRQLRRLGMDQSPVSLAERMEVYRFAESDEYRTGIQRFLNKSKRHGI